MQELCLSSYPSPNDQALYIESFNWTIVKIACENSDAGAPVAVKIAQ